VILFVLVFYSKEFFVFFGKILSFKATVFIGFYS